MASGMSEDQGRDMIVVGFLDLDARTIAEAVREEVKRTIAAAKFGAL